MNPRGLLRRFVEDYLTLDRTSKTAKYEYLDGEVRMLAGGSPDHSLIATNLTAVLTYALRKTPCVFYNSDIRLEELYLKTGVKYGSFTKSRFLTL